MYRSDRILVHGPPATMRYRQNQSLPRKNKATPRLPVRYHQNRSLLHRNKATPRLPAWDEATPPSPCKNEATPRLPTRQKVTPPLPTRERGNASFSRGVILPRGEATLGTHSTGTKINSARQYGPIR
ncbi:hypothetical protein BHM03_00034867 [Ensete ventricosum]|nr:hypothetical protein BHM03_00034867 [Ensete ventricosum]